MGHNLGMLHDFDDSHGGQGGPCDGTGFMSYGSAPQQWSTCSKNDFEAHYNNVASQGGWCLPCKFYIFVTFSYLVKNIKYVYCTYPNMIICSLRYCLWKPSYSTSSTN